MTFLDSALLVMTFLDSTLLAMTFLDSALLAMTFLYHLNAIHFRMTNLFTAQSSESTQHPIEGAQVVRPDADFSFPFNVSLKHNSNYDSTPPNTLMGCTKQNLP